MPRWKQNEGERQGGGGGNENKKRLRIDNTRGVKEKEAVSVSSLGTSVNRVSCLG